MNCPKCGGKTRVADVRHPNSNDETLRSRVCAVCGFLFHTVEYLAADDNSFKNYWMKSYRPTTRYRKGK